MKGGYGYTSLFLSVRCGAERLREVQLISLVTPRLHLLYTALGLADDRRWGTTKQMTPTVVAPFTYAPKIKIQYH